MRDGAPHRRRSRRRSRSPACRRRSDPTRRRNRSRKHKQSRRCRPRRPIKNRRSARSRYQCPCAASRPTAEVPPPPLLRARALREMLRVSPCAARQMDHMVELSQRVLLVRVPLLVLLAMPRLPLLREAVEPFPPPPPQPLSRPRRRRTAPPLLSPSLPRSRPERSGGTCISHSSCTDPSARRSS